MQIRCPHIEGIQQHFVQELDDGSVFYLGSGVCALCGFFNSDVIELKITSPADQRIHGFAGGLGATFYQAAEFVVFRNNPVHSHLGSEFDLLGSLLIRWVCRGHDEPVVSFAENHHPVGTANLRVQQIFGKSQGVDCIQIEQGGAKNGRHRVCQIGSGHSAGAGQLGDKTGTPRL